jgi:SAM-dependent methyltransferase
MQRLERTARKANERYCRLKVVESLVDIDRFCLNVGSKEVHFRNSLNLDINVRYRPHVVADTRHLPFRSRIFEQVLFTDVIEHLPEGDELTALIEIHRVLREKGELVLTTPNRRLLFMLLDPALYVFRHRHYSLTKVREMLETCGFRCIEIFTSGFIWACANVLWYVFITYPVKRMFDYSLPYVPLTLQSFEDKEYEKAGENGYTIFIKALKREVT